MKNEYISQDKNILKHLKNKSITPLEALKKYGCFRLSAIIYRLKKEGYKIDTVMIYNKRKRYAKYFLIKNKIK